MQARSGLKRINVYVNPEDLEKVARELGCRPSEAVRLLIDNYLLATEIDQIRRRPGGAPDLVFRTGPDYELPEIPETDEIEPVE